MADLFISTKLASRILDFPKDEPIYVCAVVLVDIPCAIVPRDSASSSVEVTTWKDGSRVYLKNLLPLVKSMNLRSRNVLALKRSSLEDLLTSGIKVENS